MIDFVKSSFTQLKYAKTKCILQNQKINNYSHKFRLDSLLFAFEGKRNIIKEKNRKLEFHTSMKQTNNFWMIFLQPKIHSLLISMNKSQIGILKFIKLLAVQHYHFTKPTKSF